MFTYTIRRNRFGLLSGNNSSGNLTLGDGLMNDADRKYLAKRNWPFKKKLMNFTTTANQSTLTLPANFQKLNNIFLLAGSTRYDMTEVTTRDEWIRITSTPSDSALYPNYYYIRGNVIEFYPIISTASNTLTVEYSAKQKDLSIADYTTGTITTIANGDTTVTGSGTSWTSQMAGRMIRITDANAAGSGDGEWYEIASVTSATVLELNTNYQGTSISGGSATYTIGQVSLLPEDYQIISLYDALEDYFASGQDTQLEQSDRYKRKKDELLEDLIRVYGAASDDPVIEDDDIVKLNHNLFVTG